MIAGPVVNEWEAGVELPVMPGKEGSLEAVSVFFILSYTLSYGTRALRANTLIIHGSFETVCRT